MIMIKSTKILYTSLVLLTLGFGVYIFYSTAFRKFHPVIDKQPKLEYPAIRNQERIDPTIVEVKNLNREWYLELLLQSQFQQLA